MNPQEYMQELMKVSRKLRDVQDSVNQYEKILKTPRKFVRDPKTGRITGTELEMSNATNSQAR
jgi:hypothetical protein